MNLQEILGDSYHDGMTYEEVATALSGMKLADLSTGEYVDKRKYNDDLQAKDAEIQNKAKALHDKMTADEQKAAEDAAKDARIAELEQSLKDQAMASNRDKASVITNDIRTILDIKSDDNAFNSFVESISSDNSDSTTTLSTYITKLVKDAYERGKKDSTKDKLGAFSKGVTTQGTPESKELGTLGKELAKESVSSVDSNLYFKRN